MAMDLTLVLIPFLFSSLFLALHYLPYYLLQRPKPEPGSPRTLPGSTGLPFVGETLDLLFKGKNGVPERFALDRMKKYSSKVFKTSLFGQPMAVLCGAEGNKFLFSNENKLVKPWWPRSVEIILDTAEMKIDPGDKAMIFRNFILPFIKPSSLHVFVSIMDFTTKQHMKAHWEGKNVITAFPLVKKYTFTVACRLFLGIEDEDIVAKLEKLFGELVSGLFSMPVNLPGTNFNRALKAKAKLQKEINALINQWKSDFSQGKMSSTRSMLSEVLHEAFDDDKVLPIILSSIIVTYDTTSIALANIIMYLAQLPHIFDKVLTEQREIAKSKGQQEMLNWEDLQKMKYLWNVVSEVLRLHPPGFGAFREAISDIVYDGFLIPKGFKVHWNAYSTHKNSEYFKDPENFDPSRYNGNGPTPYSYVPFGGGPRMCPGREYARIKILVFMHNLITKFKWEKVIPDEKILCTPSLKPAKDLPIRLYPYKL